MVHDIDDDNLFQVISAIHKLNEEILKMYNKLKLKNKNIEQLKDVLRVYNLPIPDIRMKYTDCKCSQKADHSHLRKNEVPDGDKTYYESDINFNSISMEQPKKDNDDEIKEVDNQKANHANSVNNKVQDSDETYYNSETNFNSISMEYENNINNNDNDDDKMNEVDNGDKMNEVDKQKVNHTNLVNNEVQDSDETFYNSDDTNLNPIVVETKKNIDDEIPIINNPDDELMCNENSQMFAYKNENVNSNIQKQQELDSYDVIPKTNSSPTFPYKRNPLRKKKERMKLPGQACQHCVKFFNKNKGTGITPDKCSRHRDKFKIIIDTPPGLWSPTIRD